MGAPQPTKNDMTNIATIANCSIRWQLIFHPFHFGYEPGHAIHYSAD
jgi:hypothetical protein